MKGGDTSVTLAVFIARTHSSQPFALWLEDMPMPTQGNAEPVRFMPARRRLRRLRPLL